MRGDDALLGVVPNFSEGRRTEVIDAIVEALHVPGARVVYAEADPDHNRLDTTVLGSADAVRASALAAAAVAVARIDMRQHTGGHPRMGAADVIPFMPVRGVTMDRVRRGRARLRARSRRTSRPAGVPLRSRRAGARPRVARRRAPGRVRGPARGGRARRTASRLRAEPHRAAGATAVGARVPLVAFNVYLDGTDEAAAKAIARALRESNGGLPASEPSASRCPSVAASSPSR